MTTPDRIYIEVLNGITTPRWAPNREDKTDVEYVRADMHEAEIDALKAENADCRAKYAKVTAMLASHYVLLPEVEP